ncbi:sulfotransferase 1A3-like [Mya arenaria]|nr:sulfotransferase 1A3-like [Mya arenaria]
MYRFTERRRQEDVPGGDTVLYDVDDVTNYRLPTFGNTFEQSKSIYNHLPDLKLRDDDIFLNSFPKTGANWLWEMMNVILNRLDDITGDVKDAKRKRLKCIFVVRNPKDVAVSFYNHTVNLCMYDYKGKFENYLQMFMRGETDYGSYPQYLLEWQQFITENPDWPIHIMYYENMKADCFGELKKLFKFLEQDVSDDDIADVVKKCDFNRMRKMKGTLFTADQQEIFKGVYRTGFTDIMRKGEIGDWKNWFTVAQNELFDAWWADQTKDLNMFSFTYE